MKTMLFTLTLSLLGLSLYAQPNNSNKGFGVCKDDSVKFCKDINPGDGRVMKCLLEHKKELSKACAERMEKVDINKINEMGTPAYKSGYKAGLKKGMKNGIKKAKGYMNNFNNTSSTEGVKGLNKSKKASWEGLCKEDSAKICKDVKPGDGRVKKCLIDNLDKLSPLCKAKMDKFVVKK